MKITVDKNLFVEWMERYQYEGHFTRSALFALFEYLQEYEEASETELELDHIAFCCEFREYGSLVEFWEDFDRQKYPDIQTIEEHTTFIPCENGGFIIGSL